MELLKNVSLAQFTSFKIGGSADYFCRVRNVDELKEALAFARGYSLPIFILGGGTNMLLSDDGFRGVVVKVELRGIEWEENTHQMFARPTEQSFGREAHQHLVRVQAGEVWDALVAETVVRGLWGLENLSGIPGTVGGAPVQNVGAYGSEVKDTILWVEVLDTRTGELRQLSNAECAFAYRDSIFKKPEGKHLIVTRVAFQLRGDGAPNLKYKDLAEYFAGKPSPSLAEIRRAVLEIRARKFPDLQTHGTAGSFFKNPIISKEKFDELKKKFPELPGFPIENISTLPLDKGEKPRQQSGRGGGISKHKPPLPPSLRSGYSPLEKGERKKGYVKIPLAWILDNICNLKGFSRGRAALWKDHPLVLVNKGGASASAVSALADDVARIVKEKTGIEIEREVHEVF